MACSASAPPRCWRRCASGTSDASGSRTWCRCSATGRAGSRWPCSCSSAPARRRGRRRSPPCRWPGSSASGRCSPPSPTATAASPSCSSPTSPGPRSSPPCSSRSRSAALLVLAFLAGLATPPFEAARSAALPDLVPEDRYGEALALAGHLGAVVARHRLRARRSAAHRGRAGGGARHQLGELPRVGDPAARAPPHRRRRAGRGAGHASGSSLGDGAASLFRDRLVRRALVIVAVTGALGTVGEALVVPVRRRGRHARGQRSGCWPPPSRSARCSAPRRSPAGTRDHHRLLRNAAWCGAVTSAAAAPLFWLEASGAFAFVAFAIAGGMFAVSIPTNTVIGMRLSRDTAGLGDGHRGGRAHGQPGARRRRRWARGQPGRIGPGHRRRPRRAPPCSASGRRCPRRTRPSTCAGRSPARPAGPAPSRDRRRPRDPRGRPPSGRHHVNLGAAAVRIHGHGPTHAPSRPLLAALFAAVLVVGVAGCGDDDEPTATGDAGTTTADGGDDRRATTTATPPAGAPAATRPTARSSPPTSR